MGTKDYLFNQAVADDICYRLIGGETLKDICVEDGMPTTSVVQVWRHENPAFAEQYAKARESQAETIFDEMLEIADDSTNDYMTKTNHRTGEEYEAVNDEHINRSKLRIQTRQWILPRLSKKMNEKTHLDLTNSDGSMAMSDEAVAARLTAIHQAVKKRLAAKNPEGFVGDDGSDLA